MSNKSFEVILAATSSGEIGYKNTIPWRLKGDLKRFSEITMDNIVVMGRHTYESLPVPLKGRIVIVVSNSLTKKTELNEPVHFVPSLSEAIILSNQFAAEKIFIAGGARLYEAALKFPCTVHLTTVYKKAKEGYDIRINGFNMRDFDLVGEPVAVYERDAETGIVEVSHIYSTYTSKNLILYG